MARAIVFLLAVYVLAVCSETIIENGQYIIRYGEELTFKLDKDEGHQLETCTVYTPDRRTINLFPNETDDSLIDFYSEDRSPSSPCGVRISKMEKSHEDTWKLTGVYSKDGVEKRKEESFKVILRGDDKINEPLTLATSRDGSVSFDLDDYMFQAMRFCYLKTPKGEVFELHPKLNVTDSNIVIQSHLRCAFSIEKVTMDYVGEWQMSTDIKVFKDDQFYVYQTLNVAIEETVDGLPSNLIKVHPNYDVKVSLSEDVKNWKKCELIPPFDDTSKSALYTSNSPNCLYNIELFKPNMNGTWTIRGYGDMILEANIDIIVQDQPDIDTEVTVVHGVPADLIFGPENAVYCEATDPHGQLMVQQSGQCKINLRRATFQQEGLWNVRVGLPGAISLITYEYKVRVEDLGEQTPGRVVTHTEIGADNKYVRMVCKVLVDSMKSCRMIRADGEVFILNEGIGQGRYRFYKNDEPKPENSIDFVQCGIHIDNPTTIDVHPWKCVVVQDDNTEAGSSIFIESRDESEQELVPDHTNLNLTSSERVNVTMESEFQMSCKYPLPVSYCWFRSPNGSIFSLMDQTNETNYEYTGTGLNNGDCGIKIKSSRRSDHGLWSCNVETSSVEDSRTMIRVQIFDSLLVAKNKDIIWHRGMSFSCRTFDGSPLDYCRFIRPDGVGINPRFTNLSEYSGQATDLESGHCELHLKNYLLVDMGRWRCLGKQRSKDIEHSDIVTIYPMYWAYYNNSHSMGAWFLYIFTVTIIILLLSIAVFKFHASYSQRRSRRSRSRSISSRSDLNRSGSRFSSMFIRRSAPPPYTPEVVVRAEDKDISA